jgi:DNA-binding Lrp family transcriptional regulator
MDAYVYLRIQPGRMADVLAGLTSKTAVRRAIAVVGDWDVLVHAEGVDLSAIAGQVLSEIHHIPGVGLTGFGGPQPPPIIGDACYVRVKAEPGAAAGIVERVTEMQDVAGVAVTGGVYDLLICVAQPWEVASGVILEEIHDLPGVVETDTLISIQYEEPAEERDKFSTWN